MKYALITGATDGFGPVIADHLSKKDYVLILHGRNLEKLKSLQASLGDLRHQIFVADATNLPDAASDLCDFILKTCESPDAIIHHVGGPTRHRSALSSFSDWADVLNLNVFFASELNKILLPPSVHSMREINVIHISSISALTLRGAPTYACSKALLNAYIVSLARELAQTNIRITGIMPGAFITKSSNWSHYLKDHPEIVDDFLKHHHATNRLGVPTEILPAIDFLLNPLNTFSQGCIVNIDGGTM